MQDQKERLSQSTQAPSPSESALHAPDSVNLPVRVHSNGAKRRLRRTAAAILVVLLGAAGGGYYAWKATRPALPVGISVGNGRIEADEIDIDT